MEWERCWWIERRGDKAIFLVEAGTEYEEGGSRTMIKYGTGWRLMTQADTKAEFLCFLCKRWNVNESIYHRSHAFEHWRESRDEMKMEKLPFHTPQNFWSCINWVSMLQLFSFFHRPTGSELPSIAASMACIWLAFPHRKRTTGSRSTFETLVGCSSVWALVQD